MDELQQAGRRWHKAFGKAFITKVSEGGAVGEPSKERYIKIAFRSFDDLNEGYDAMVALASLTGSVNMLDQETVEGLPRRDVIKSYVIGTAIALVLIITGYIVAPT